MFWGPQRRIRKAIEGTFVDAARTFRVQIEMLTQLSLPRPVVNEYEPLLLTIWVYYFHLQNVGLPIPKAMALIGDLSKTSGAFLASQLDARVAEGQMAADAAKATMTNTFGEMGAILAQYDDAFNRGKVILRTLGADRPDFALPFARVFIDRLCKHEVDRSMLRVREVQVARLIAEHMETVEKIVKQGV